MDSAQEQIAGDFKQKARDADVHINHSVQHICCDRLQWKMLSRNVWTLDWQCCNDCYVYYNGPQSHQPARAILWDSAMTVLWDGCRLTGNTFPWVQYKRQHWQWQLNKIWRLQQWQFHETTATMVFGLMTQLDVCNYNDSLRGPIWINSLLLTPLEHSSLALRGDLVRPEHGDYMHSSLLPLHTLSQTSIDCSQREKQHLEDGSSSTCWLHAGMTGPSRG